MLPVIDKRTSVPTTRHNNSDRDSRMGITSMMRRMAAGESFQVTEDEVLATRTIIKRLAVEGYKFSLLIDYEASNIDFHERMYRCWKV